MSMRMWMLLLIGAGCGGSPGAPAAPATGGAGAGAALGLAVSLEVEPHRITMGTRRALVVRSVLVNLAEGPLDPAFHTSELVVNGQPSAYWDEVVTGGAFPPGSEILPPRGRKGRALQYLGEGLFEQPGTYTLVLRMAGASSAPVRVVVQP